MSDLPILVGAVLFAFGTPTVLLYLARDEGHGVGDSGGERRGDANADRASDVSGDGGSDASDDVPGSEGTAVATSQHTVGQYRRGRK